jgi:hypothetical protein
MPDNASFLRANKPLAGVVNPGKITPIRGPIPPHYFECKRFLGNHMIVSGRGSE